MSNFLCTGKNKKKYQKFALVDVFREKHKSKITSQKTENAKINNFANQLAEDNVCYQKIQNLAWKGIPHCLRPKIWKYLLRYSLVHAEGMILAKKRDQYRTLKKNYEKPIEQFTEAQRKIYQTIDGDVKRTGSDFNSLFKEPIIRQLLRRLLYIWHMRHPASGYVQGICDLAIPFFVVFISEYLPLNIEQQKFQLPVQSLQQETLLAIQADTYGCMSKMLELVTQNYTNGFSGLQQSYSKTQQLLYKIDEQLYNHLIKQKFDLFAFSFRSISTMMLRLFNPMVGIRVFDTFISLEDEYPVFMIYLLIAVLEKFAKEILNLRSDDLLTFIQKLPTKEWTQDDIDLVVAEAYVYKKLYNQKL